MASLFFLLLTLAIARKTNLTTAASPTSLLTVSENTNVTTAPPPSYLLTVAGKTNAATSPPPSSLLPVAGDGNINVSTAPPPFSLLTIPGAGNTNATTAPPPLSLFNPTPQPQLQFNSIVDALISTGNFKNWANLLAEVDPAIIPFSATLFVPDDDAFIAGVNSSDVPLKFLDPLLFPYHIVPLRISFAALQLFPAGSRLPTLLPGFSLLITNTSATNFTIDGAPVCRPDIYLNGVVSVHGIGAVLDYTLFGRDIVPDSPPPSPSRLPDFSASEFDDYDVDRIPKGGAPSCNFGSWVGFLLALIWVSRNVD